MTVDKKERIKSSLFVIKYPIQYNVVNYSLTSLKGRSYRTQTIILHSFFP